MKPLENVITVCLCGSTKFKQEYEVVNKALTLAGMAVFTVGCFPHADHFDITEKEKEIVDRLHLWKIDKADCVVIIWPGCYIGESTLREKEWAQTIGKQLFFISDFRWPRLDNLVSDIKSWWEKVGKIKNRR